VLAPISMYIERFHVHNYKSILDSQAMVLGPGFNVIVGKNNSGKTAMLQALFLRFQAKPHRSSVTVPYPGANPPPDSVVDVSFAIKMDEFRQLLGPISENLQVPVPASEVVRETIGRFQRQLNQPTQLLEVRLRNGEIESASLGGYGNLTDLSRWTPGNIRVDDESVQFEGSGNDVSGGSIHNSFGYRLANALRDRIFCFQSERFNIGRHPVGDSPVLRADAQNLPQVLQLLQTQNPPRYARLLQLTQAVFPEIQQITVPPAGSDAHVHIWFEDPINERQDLAVPLLESGTGTAQVLAMLYVVLDAGLESRVVLIDEPQSFLHPGAARALFGILKTFKQHQYVITTHSPVALASLGVTTLLLARRNAAETKVDQVNTEDAKSLEALLAELGVRFSDVFGAERILWVEGRTEEICFPILVHRLLERSLQASVIMGVVHIGDLDRRHARTALQIYTRLSGGGGLLPPALGFVLDQDERTATERQDLERQSRGVVRFLPRRMYENFLINPEAIASVASAIPGFRDNPLTAREVSDWVQANGRCFGTPATPFEPVWIREVNAGKLLIGIFAEFSEGRVEYDKVLHGLALTEHITEHAPTELDELRDLLRHYFP